MAFLDYRFFSRVVFFLIFSRHNVQMNYQPGKKLAENWLLHSSNLAETILMVNSSCLSSNM